MWKTFAVYKILCKINGLFMFFPNLMIKTYQSPSQFFTQLSSSSSSSSSTTLSYIILTHTLVSVPNWWGGRLLHHQVSFCKSWKTIYTWASCAQRPDKPILIHEFEGGFMWDPQLWPLRPGTSLAGTFTHLSMTVFVGRSVKDRPPA